ncbi:MAG TPA: ATP-binding protein [Verrucomicrobiae bacterium]|nr:ATP-binding protein [Verrucomicrobiae bacterium]
MTKSKPARRSPEESDQLQLQTKAVNEQLVLSGLRQHELFEVANTANAQLRAEITERKVAEALLRESEERFRTLFELVPVAVYSCGASGVIQEFNQRAVELWGREPAPGDTDERFCGSFKLFRSDGSFMPHEQCPMAEVIAGKIPAVHDSEVLIERPDGSWVTVVVNIHGLKNARGEITGAINCFYDITERKRSEEALRRAQVQLADRAVQLEAMVAERTAKLTMAHEQLLADIIERKRLEGEIAKAVEAEQLRLGGELHDGLAQEVTGATMILYTLQKQMAETSPAYAQKLHEVQKMLLKTVTQARNLASGFYPVELEKHGLGVALQQLAQRTQESFGISCVVEADRQPPKESKNATAIQLFRVAQEAVHNATKHSRAAHILIRLTVDHDALRLTVKDDGVGLRPKRQQSGGMGMRIMQHRMGLIGGKLEVRNADGGGVVVSCALPEPKEKGKE